MDRSTREKNMRPTMPDTPTSNKLYCEIRLRGHLEARWATWFDGLAITLDADGTTLLSGPVADQAALHGLLKKVRDVGLPLLSVNSIGPDSQEVRAT
jgi:hypothetical protein